MARTRGANGRGRDRGKGSRGRGRDRSVRGKHSTTSNNRVELEESKETRGHESLSERGRDRGKGSKTSDTMVESIEAEETEHPLLTMQLSHKSQAIIDKEPVAIMTVRHSQHFLEWDDRYEPYLKASGFYGVHQIQRVIINDAFICALVERWRPETHTFHLSVGEMTVTLEDVAVLLGLPVDGKPVCGTTNMNWADLIRDYLGVIPDAKCMANKSALSLTWLRTKFGSLDPKAPNVEVQQYFRACILGSFMIPDLTGNSVPCMYLILLRNLEEIKLYSWGSAILAKMYRMLCHGCRKKAMQIAGPIGLLQMWAWERFKLLSPVALKGVTLCGLRPEDVPPRGYYWSAKHEWKRQKKGTVEYYRSLLDIMEDGDVIWTPYDTSIRSNLPPACNARDKCLLTIAPLIDFSTVETYHPDRVMRQFRKFQVIPPPARSTLPDIHKVSRQKYPINDWLEYHSEHVASWNKREETIVEETKDYDHQLYPAYMEWYKSATIPTFIPYTGLSADGASVGERPGRARAWTNELVAEAVQIGKDLGRKMQTDIDLATMHEIRKMFRFCRDVVDNLSDVFIFDDELKGEGISPFNWKKRKLCFVDAESSKATGEGAATQASQRMRTGRDSKVAKTNILKSAMRTGGRWKRNHGEGEGSKGEGQKKEEGAATQASQKMTTGRDSKVAKTNILKSAMRTGGRRKRSHGERSSLAPSGRVTPDNQIKQASQSIPKTDKEKMKNSQNNSISATDEKESHGSGRPKKNKMEIEASQVTVMVSDELRCCRTNGSRWHCSEKAMPNSKFCTRHFFPCKSTSSKKK